MNREKCFFNKVHDTGSCWEWTGTRSGGGYGMFREGSRILQAHRWCYEFLRAEIPEGLHLDHLCRNRGCVNPWHLEPVTRQVNTRRGVSAHGDQSHCIAGHPFDHANTYRHGGRRYCRACRTRRAQGYRENQRKMPL